MKKHIVIAGLLLLASLGVQAQVATNIKPDAGGKIGEFGEWQKLDISLGGESATAEYRVRLGKRMGIACHYDLEIKNTSNIKLNVLAASTYYDKLVKSNYGDEGKESVKPGKSVSIRFIAQGCKKEKGADTDDFGHCMACEFGIDLYLSK